MPQVQHTYAVGDVVEAKDPGHYPGGWRRAWVRALSPYRGKPGYDIAWSEVPDGADGIRHSAGGWTDESNVRPVQTK